MSLLRKSTFIVFLFLISSLLIPSSVLAVRDSTLQYPFKSPSTVMSLSGEIAEDGDLVQMDDGSLGVYGDPDKKKNLYQKADDQGRLETRESLDAFWNVVESIFAVMVIIVFLFVSVKYVLPLCVRWLGIATKRLAFFLGETKNEFNKGLKSDHEIKNKKK